MPTNTLLLVVQNPCLLIHVSQSPDCHIFPALLCDGKLPQVLDDFVATIGCERATLMFVDTPAQVGDMNRVLSERYDDTHSSLL